MDKSKAQKVTPDYLAFPFRIESNGARQCDRASHIYQQIEQVLFTNPYERVFRPEFGAGIKKLVFEPNSPALETITENRLLTSLTEALKGEVDPNSIKIAVKQEEEKLKILISYTLAMIGQPEQHQFLI